MIRSIATITVDPTLTALTTLQRAKDELSITDSASDALLQAKIDEASSDIEAHTNRVFAKATLSETFWCDAFEGYRQGHSRHLNSLTLARTPIVSITSVTVDDAVVAASEYRLDAQSGLLFRLTSDGFPSVWCWSKAVVIVYVAGYDLPGSVLPVVANLPPALQAAALSLLNSYWQSRGRDPMVRGESIPGLGDVQYWVGSVGESGQLPPDVMAKITPFRRYIIG